MFLWCSAGGTQRRALNLGQGRLAESCLVSRNMSLMTGSHIRFRSSLTCLGKQMGRSAGHEPHFAAIASFTRRPCSVGRVPALSEVLLLLRSKGIFLVVPLFFQSSWLGAKVCYPPQG